MFNEGWLHAIPETTGLFKLFEVDESQFDFDKYNEIMKEIINKYVAGTFNVLANSV